MSKSYDSAPKGCLNCCMWTTRWIPVLFIMALTLWSYYAYVVELCFSQIGNDSWFKKLIYLIFYHIFLTLFVASYYQTIFASVKRPPDDCYLTETEIYQMATASTELSSKAILEAKSRDLPLLNRTNSGGVRFCEKCKCIKPDRSHHCSVCQTCVLKMDHHCPWVNNCVGHHNYKFFILFLGYSTLYCIYIAGTSLEYFIEFWTQLQQLEASRFHILFLFFVAIMFAISISSLFFYHIYLSAKNCTTLESFRPPVFATTLQPDKNGFNVGRAENFKQVFGSSWIKAFLPIHTSTVDGISFPLSVKQSTGQATGSRAPASTSTGNDRSYIENEISSSATTNQLTFPLTKELD